MTYYRMPCYRERAAFHREFWQALGEFLRRKFKSRHAVEAACRS